MLYRQMEQYRISVLCYGTATFVAGKLRPNADSEIGMRSLQQALDGGINLIHSNSNLKTQWAIHRVLSRNKRMRDIHHLIKIETPLTEGRDDFRAFFDRELTVAMQNLGTNFVTGIVHEIDIKKTHNPDLLKKPDVIRSNLGKVREAFESARDQGKVGMLISMAHNPMQMEIAMDTNYFSGFASYYSMVNTWVVPFLDELLNSSKFFLGIRPLKRGILTDRYMEQANEYVEQASIHLGRENLQHLNHLCQEGIIQEPLQQFAVRFALAHPSVSSVIVGMSQPKHVQELVDAAGNPLPLNVYYEIVSSGV